MPFVVETRNEVTSAQIRKLRDASLAAGDMATVAICDRALTGEPQARKRCAELLAAR